MKKIVSFSLLFLIVFSGSAQDNTAIKWMRWEEAVKANKKTPKKIMVDVYTQWCGWCRHMDANTFTNPVIIKYVNEKYYAVKLDAEQKEPISFDGYNFVNPNPDTPRSTHQFAASMLDNEMSYPTTVFLDEHLKRLQIQKGFLPPASLEPILRYYGDNAYLKMNGEEFKKNFVSEIK